LRESTVLDDVEHFLRRIPPAVSWRAKARWDPIARSPARRAAEGHAVWAKRAVTERVRRTEAKSLVVRFANAHGAVLPELQWFAEEVDRVSDGGMRVAWVNKWALATNTREETATVAGTMRGQADLGWAGTRAFGCLGVRSLDPLQTPLAFPDYAAVAAVCRDELTYEMLQPLESLGLVGLVVLPGPFRKPFAFARRLLSARDYEGAKLRIHESLVAEATYRGLGAVAVVLSIPQMASSADRLVDGLDMQIEALSGWGLRGSITFNVDLWPRTLAIVASRKSYDWLGSSEREVLHAAARKTLARALEHLDTQAQRDTDAMPSAVTPIYATEDQLAGLRERVEPVWEELRTHAETGTYLDRVTAIIGAQPG
jgi:TRAP-type C4-dicarboxylate transport system substrate-binding protein